MTSSVHLSATSVIALTQLPSLPAEKRVSRKTSTGQPSNFKDTHISQQLNCEIVIIVREHRILQLLQLHHSYIAEPYSKANHINVVM